VEAGMAMALYPNSTIIVRIGKQRSISDLAGINYIDLTDQPEKRQAFISRLKTIGLNVDDIGSDWLYSGKFNL
jgi:nucleotide-binding protein, predicted, TIR-like protein